MAVDCTKGPILSEMPFQANLSKRDNTLKRIIYLAAVYCY